MKQSSPSFVFFTSGALSEKRKKSPNTVRFDGINSEESNPSSDSFDDFPYVEAHQDSSNPSAPLQTVQTNSSQRLDVSSVFCRLNKDKGPVSTFDLHLQPVENNSLRPALYLSVCGVLIFATGCILGYGVLFQNSWIGAVLASWMAATVFSWCACVLIGLGLGVLGLAAYWVYKKHNQMDQSETQSSREHTKTCALSCVLAGCTAVSTGLVLGCGLWFPSTNLGIFLTACIAASTLSCVVYASIAVGLCFLLWGCCALYRSRFLNHRIDTIPVLTDVKKKHSIFIASIDANPTPLAVSHQIT